MLLFKILRHKRYFSNLAFVVLILVAACGKEEGSSDEKMVMEDAQHKSGEHDQPGKEQGTMKMDMKTDEDRQAQKSGDRKKDKKILYWQAPMNPSYIADKPGKSPMGMDLVPVYEGEAVGSGSTISIDPVTVQNMGVRTAVVNRQPFSRVIRTVGHIDYDEETLYDVNIKFHGWIEELYVDKTGELVRKGQPLFRVYSPELVSTQEEYLLAYKNRKELANSSFTQVSRGAESLLASARQRLQYWDISEKQIAKLETSGKILKTLIINSPASGVVIHKKAVEGMYTMEGADLFRIADLSKVWVYAHIFEYELPWIKLGQKVKMELPYVPGKHFQGIVDYLYPYLNAKTRDVKLRIVFDNPTLELKPQMYANVTIESMAGDSVLVIPSEAIIRSGTRNLVFIALGQGKFRPQEVVLGPEGEDAMVEIVSGLQEGQRIVTSSQFLLDSESRLREAIQKMLEVKKAKAEGMKM